MDTEGYLIWAHADNTFVFRIYSEDKKIFKDYDIKVDDLKIKIIDNYTCFKEESINYKKEFKDEVVA